MWQTENRCFASYDAIRELYFATVFRSKIIREFAYINNTAFPYYSGFGLDEKSIDNMRIECNNLVNLGDKKIILHSINQSIFNLATYCYGWIDGDFKIIADSTWLKTIKRLAKICDVPDFTSSLSSTIFSTEWINSRRAMLDFCTTMPFKVQEKNIYSIMCSGGGTGFEKLSDAMKHARDNLSTYELKGSNRIYYFESSIERSRYFNDTEVYLFTIAFPQTIKVKNIFNFPIGLFYYTVPTSENIFFNFGTNLIEEVPVLLDFGKTNLENFNTWNTNATFPDYFPIPERPNAPGDGKVAESVWNHYSMNLYGNFFIDFTEYFNSVLWSPV